MRPSSPRAPLFWIFSTYFAEGFPYTLIRQVSTVYFRDMRMGLESIGLTSLYGLPWVIKFLWGPLVDRFGTRREWLLWSEAILAAMLGVVVMIVSHGNVTAVAWALLPAAFVAATHDTAIDGYYMVALGKDDQAKFVGYRVMAYRIALMVGTGAIVTVGALARWGWVWAFGGGAVLMALLLLANFALLPRCETAVEGFGRLAKMRIKAGHALVILGVSGAAVGIWWLQNSQASGAFHKASLLLRQVSFSVWVSVALLAVGGAAAIAGRWLKNKARAGSEGFYAEAYISFFGQEAIGLLLAFIILMRTGEYLLSAMTAPFMVDLGIKIHYGWISGGVGLPCSIVGAMLGGYLIGQYGVRRMLWPILLAQNLTNLVYMALAFQLAPAVATNTGAAHPVALDLWPLVSVAAVHGFDQFSGGLGTALLMTFLMSLCKSEHKAAHYAIGTGVMGVSGLFTGVASGYLAARMGYGWFFGLSFALSVPGMLLAAMVAARVPKNVAE